MAKSFKHWLGTVVETELAAVIDWKNDIKNAPNIKNDPDSRFSDDGSNFRVAAGSTSLPADCKIQLVKVFSKSDPATVLLSDGAISIKATLSEDAISALEEELEETLSLDMKGDVLSLTSLTIVSTPYGPADGHVRLDVDDWQYEHHLRKTIGDPKPVEQQPQIRRLLESIKKIRSQQYADGDAGDEAPPASTGGALDAVLGASQIENGDGRNSNASKLSSRTSQPRSTLTASIMSQSHAALATQLPPRKKSRLPSLDTEGFEAEAGVNLARPSAPSLAPTTHGRPNDRRIRPLPVSTDLLKLVGAPDKPSIPITAAQDPHEVDSGAKGSEDRDASETASQADCSLNKAASPSGHGTVAEPASSVVSKRSLYARRKIPSQQQRLFEKEKKQAWFPSLPGYQFPAPNVPIELLQAWDAEPSLVELVSSQQSASEVQERNNAQEIPAASATDDSMETSDSSSDEEVPASQWPPSPTPPKREMLPPDSTVGSTQTRLPVNGSQKTPVQSPAKPPKISPESPNDSSTGTPRHASTQQLPLRSPIKQHQLPPKPPPSTFGDSSRFVPSYGAVTPDRRPLSNGYDRERPPSREYDRARAPSQDNLQDRPRSRDYHRDRPSFSPQSGPDRVPSRAPTHPRDWPPSPRDQDRRERNSREILAHEWNRKNATHRGSDSRERPRHERDSRDSRAMAPRESGRRETADRDEAVTHTRHAHPPATAPRSSGLDTVIKGTQFSNPADEMEMDVPRPLQDPAHVHQQRRREHFKTAQRREWLEANYITTYESEPYLSAVHKEYLATHPADPVTLVDFKQAMVFVFPALSGYPPRSLVKRRDMASLSRSSSVRPVSRHLDGSNDADDDPRTDSVDDTDGIAKLSSQKKRSKARAPPTEGTTAFAIYEDSELQQTGVKQGHDDQSLLDNIHHANGAGSPPPQTLFAKPSSQQQPTNGNHQQNLAPKRKLAIDHQHRTANTQDTDETARPPATATAFEDFASAWKSLKPGGAFAKPKTASTAKAPRRQMDILSWLL